MHHHRRLVGHRVVGTVKAVNGQCSAGHRVGDTFALDGHDTDGLCGLFFHDLLASIMILQFGGDVPWSENDALEVTCGGKTNAITIELRRVKE